MQAMLWPVKQHHSMQKGQHISLVLPEKQGGNTYTYSAAAIGVAVITPRAHARARGYVIGRGVCCLHFFWNQTFISQNTHFQRSMLTQIGFSSNLMASGTA